MGLFAGSFDYAVRRIIEGIYKIIQIEVKKLINKRKSALIRSIFQLHLLEIHDYPPYLISLLITASFLRDKIGISHLKPMSFTMTRSFFKF